MADCIASCLHLLSPTCAPTQHHDAKIESNTLQSAQGYAAQHGIHPEVLMHMSDDSTIIPIASGGYPQVSLQGGCLRQTYRTGLLYSTRSKPSLVPYSSSLGDAFAAETNL